ncbi:MULTISPECIES: hypothetical protein [Mesorhizobium]|uniref:Uncharacterized protein n=1 Tax=Mesorhizobium denitrificans TaxID=2294114 RepID=A0A371XBY7_9HYPH|nr:MULTISPECIES: hypothetical protein [Mesorhizobium]RFC66730.1 hypothetical protein DY251_14405 [Mesorhizobium denitrificans]
MRKKLVATCEALIALLDEIDGDENVEGTADEEPLLGWPDGGQRPTAEMSCDGDREADDCDLESGSDDERELGWQDEGSQASLQGSLYDGEPDLGFCGHGTGWREGEATDDREQENEHLDKSDYEPFLGWSEVQSQHGAQPTGEEFPIECGGSAKADGSGVRIAKKQLKENARRRKAAGVRGEILFRREEADATPMPRYMWNDQWTGNLPPEANEVLIPNFSMYRASK